MRLKGYDVYEPIGFDAFGIHSENYALKTGKHPAELTPLSIRYFREEQLKKIGAIYDWNSEVNTSSPEYYRWTQWIFIQLYKAGLAEKRESEVNWCPSCKTVLADEQVIEGACERCNTQIIKRTMSQWFFKITNYADKLLENLDTLDWTEITKNIQKSWIGRSRGTMISFETESTSEKIEVFTTRADTVFGVTFISLAPEHPLSEQFVIDEKKSEYREFLMQVEKMDDVVRTSLSRDKTGIFTGSYAIHPFTRERIPIWLGDYVLASYGTGAVMGVPAHDDRDYVFAQKYGIPITKVIQCEDSELPYTDKGKMINSQGFTGWTSDDFIGKAPETTPFMKKQVQYHLHDWCLSRQRYWGPPIPILYCENCGTVPVPESDLPVLLPVTDDYIPDGSGLSPLARNKEFVLTTCPICGGKARRETDVSDNFFDSAWYFLRYISPRNSETVFDSELMKQWLPVDMYIGGNEHANLHLMYARFITMALYDLGILTFEEPFTRFRGHGMIIKDGQKMSKSKGNIINPNDYFETHGVDTLRTYVMFMGNFLEGGDFRESGLDAVKRFINRVWDLTDLPEGTCSLKAKIKMAETIRRVSFSIENLKYNAAVAALMELVNLLQDEKEIERDVIVDLARLLSPFAPFICEEIHALFGGKGSILLTGFPSGYEKYLELALVELPVQINGKLRGKIIIEQNLPEELIVDRVHSDNRLKLYFLEKTIRKTIYVKDKIINFILGSS
jgi:leucyl-tRNA synthetase